VVLLFGLMVVAYHVQLYELPTALAWLLTRRCRSVWAALARLGATAGVLAAVLTNTAACLVLTPVATRLVHKLSLPAVPLAVTLTAAANVGSTATPLGSVHVILIVQAAQLAFATYVKWMLLPALVGVALAVAGVAAAHARVLHEHPRDLFAQYDDAQTHADAADAISSVYANDPFSVFVTAPGSSLSVVDDMATPAAGAMEDDAAALSFLLDRELGTVPLSPTPSADAAAAAAGAPARWRARARETCAQWPTYRWTRWMAAAWAYGTLVATVAALFAGVPLGVVGAAAAAVALLGQALWQRSNPRAALLAVDYPLLLFLLALFVVVAALEATGYPRAVTDALFGSLDMAAPAGLAVFAIVAAVATNALTAAPAVLLLLPVVSEQPAALQLPYALALAWASTVGSAMTPAGCVWSETVVHNVDSHLDGLCLCPRGAVRTSSL
jgi:Na+/H+ antiporter NhaD/arsenite permease-like protein